MRNVLGVILVAAGLLLGVWPCSHTLAMALAGAALVLGSLLLVIDVDGR